ncbi:hypothetical protein [Formosa maritima]|uniref:Lipoprotein n=1 Tax=Formosa maritima TaxID=2592046 RepID=A0A5D0GIY7_9FLAO|nr:hypothetical protein [Formosa maritima]TYA58985.1 hypothetical protein FVF61_02210 [Formosa maritima]
MKKTLLSIAIVAFILSSCNNTKKEEQTLELKTVNTEISTSEEIEENQILNNNWKNEIQLDNGSQWLANIETKEGVQKMKEMLKSIDTNTLEEYHNLAAELTHAKNYVIKECTMKGPSHDNLHVWLLPLMEKIDALAETNNLEEAAKIKQSIAENVNAYDNYFK